MSARDRYQEILGHTGSIEVRAGQHADVVIDATHHRAWRFPRYEEDRASLTSLIERLRAARNLGLPAPEVLGGDLDAPLGQAHVILRHVPGVGLTDPAIAALRGEAQQRLAADLDQLLTALSGADLSRWPASGRKAWRQQWVDLRNQVVERVLPLLSPAGAARARAEVEGAVKAADSAAEDALIHGDLGGVNVLVDASSGALTGVLDWDSAGPGDPAVDLGALAVSLPAPVLDLLLSRCPSLQTRLARARAYAATFALQDAVFGLRSGDARAVKAGLASYPRAAP
jgi:aminoglycoside 2''-phosphotransferase